MEAKAAAKYCDQWDKPPDKWWSRLRQVEQMFQMRGVLLRGAEDLAPVPLQQMSKSMRICSGFLLWNLHGLDAGGVRAS